MDDALRGAPAASASAICDADAAAPGSSGSGPFAQPVRQRLALEVLHHQEVTCQPSLADVVEDADVGMVEGGDGAGLRCSKRRATLGVGGQHSAGGP